MKRELAAAVLVALVVLGFPAALFGYQTWRTASDGVRVIDLTANVPDAGGWTPDTIQVRVGERVRLRISSPDVVHGFEIPALDIRIDEILPGHVQQVEFVATRAGHYAFACTRWCSVDHWRMRGAIEVIESDGAPLPAAPFEPPLYQQLGIDIDAMHPAQHLPSQRPSAGRGVPLDVNPVPDFRTQSPAAIFTRIRADVAQGGYDDGQTWDALAATYARTAGAESITRGARLYARDCAACHGERGDGTGPAGRNLPGMAAMDPMMPRGPADFTDSSQMLGASDALLQGKVLRGGMGTGMPEWGSLYTSQDLWDVVAYVRSFTFEFNTKP